MKPTRMTQTKSALLPSKERSADPKNPPIKGEPMNSITNRYQGAIPRHGTTAHAALLALIDAGPAGVCPQAFFDGTGKHLRYAIHDLRRRRWDIVTRLQRQRTESGTLYVLEGE